MGSNLLFHLLLRHMTFDDFQGEFRSCIFVISFVAYCKPALPKKLSHNICRASWLVATWRLVDFRWWRRRMIFLAFQCLHWCGLGLLRRLLHSDLRIDISGRQSFHI